IAAIGGVFAATTRVAQAAPPTFTKAFGAPSMMLGGSTTLTFTITNPNLCPPGDSPGTCDIPAIALTGLTFTDTLAGGLVLAPVPSVNGCGGTVTASAGTGTISLAGGILPGS